MPNHLIKSRLAHPLYKQYDVTFLSFSKILNGGMGLLNYGQHMELWNLGLMGLFYLPALLTHFLTELSGAVSLTDSSNNQVNLTNNQWEMKV